MSIDLNCDLGEDPNALATGREAELLDLVTSANVACGGHAGDEASMRAVVRLARDRGVAVGAHPSFPDRARFGRVDLALPAEEVEAVVRRQLEVLLRVAREEGVVLAHVKAHGALYHAASARPEVARALVRAARVVGPDVLLVAQAGSAALQAFRDLGARTVAEAFVDRRYEADGRLRSRDLPGALLLDPAEAAAQAVGLAREGRVTTQDGRSLDVRAGTLCVHGDTPGAVALARSVRAALAAAGIACAAPGRGPAVQERKGPAGRIPPGP